jgi:glycosyltransferase involved in cell wall biosynthesis
MPANVSFHKMLSGAFPEFDVVVVDVNKLLRARLLWRVANVLCTLREYGWEILTGGKRFRTCMSKTACYHSQVRKLVSDVVGEGEYAFSIQIQSLFDASTAGTKHYVYTDHTHLANLQYESFDRRHLFSKRWIAQETSVYRNAAMVFVRSTNIRRSLIDDYACEPGRVECVYAGSNASPPQIRADTDRYAAQNILFVGLDWHRKGGPALVAAFRDLLQTHPNARLTIVGASPALDVANCDVIGRVPVERVGTYFESASVFCLPTRIEPFGIVFVEALSYSLPIVATRVGAVPDMVVDGLNGYLVAPDDVAGLTRYLRELLSDPGKCEALGCESRKLAESRYNWKAVGERIRAHVLVDDEDRRSNGHID